jgi:CheY-like chemotaxis protein
MIEQRILIVDDEKTHRHVLGNMLTKLGHTVDIADGPKAALALLDNQNYPIIITDLSMPDMDGAELCQKIRQTNTDSIIYALSGYLADYNAQKLEALGFDGFLCKPAMLDVLKQSIDGALDKLAKKQLKN